MIADRPVKNDERFRQTESGVYARDTRCGSLLAHSIKKRDESCRGSVLGIPKVLPSLDLGPRGLFGKRWD